jgi:hypothetical protein
LYIVAGIHVAEKFFSPLPKKILDLPFLILYYAIIEWGDQAEKINF